MRGNSDPDDPLYKRFRREQSAAPFVGRSPSDPGGEPDDADPCPLCGRTGGWRTCEGEEDDDNDSDETDRIVRRTQTEHEGTRRMDVPDRQAVLDAYRAYDLELARAWVGKND
jgi:hypothetical protein